jgi:glycosyltransferase involved in cell wall biosynthesis
MLPDATKLYGAADVLAASSRGEGMPFTVVEALCSGTPVVASDIPGHRFFGEALEACAITERDPGRIAAAIASFLDMEPSRRAQVCELARQWIVERLDLASAASRLVDEYERTVGEAGRTGNGGAGS